MKDVEKRDAVLTSDKQIERLVKPGSKYLNLNPYEVSRNSNENKDIVVETNQTEVIVSLCLVSNCKLSLDLTEMIGVFFKIDHRISPCFSLTSWGICHIFLF